MFTGIIEEMGVLKGIKHGAKSSVLTIAADKVLEGTKLGDSICTNGVCLTVTKLGSGTLMPMLWRNPSGGQISVI